jgi:lipooligosaccharide transport system permease protein
LFSGTFFPVSQLPEVFRWIAYATPLWHGVALVRSLTLGEVGAADVLHIAYLATWAVVGIALAARQYRRKLGV